MHFVRSLLKLFAISVCVLFFLYSIFYIKFTWMTAEEKSWPVTENFKRELLSAFISAEKITITEHSDIGDWSREEFEYLETKNLPEIIYRELELGFYQRVKLFIFLKAFAIGSGDGPSLCIFSSHHSLRFYSADGPAKTLEVCFECNQLIWNEKDISTSSLMYRILRYEINSLGMSDNRNWSSYLNEWRVTHSTEIK